MVQLHLVDENPDLVAAWGVFFRPFPEVAVCQGNLLAIAEQSRRVSGINVADSAQIFAVAAEKGRTDADSASAAPDGRVQFHAELHHGIGFVDVRVIHDDDRVAPRTGSSEAGRTVKLFKVPKVITER